MKRWAPREMVIAGLATPGIMAGAVTGTQWAAHVAVTRDGKGILNPHPIAVDEQLGRAFIANPSHLARSVNVLAARSGRLLYSVPVRMFPIATAVDEQSPVLVSPRCIRPTCGHGERLHTRYAGCRAHAPVTAARPRFDCSQRLIR